MTYDTPQSEVVRSTCLQVMRMLKYPPAYVIYITPATAAGPGVKCTVLLVAH